MIKSNTILEDHGDWLLIDISTDKHPNASMAIDRLNFNEWCLGRIYASYELGAKYISASYYAEKSYKPFHRTVIDCDGLQVDHINHGTMYFIDNRKANLRAATSSENNRNRKLFKNNKSGTPGVYLDKVNKRWLVTIGVNGKSKYIGTFDNIEIAIGARKQAEREFFGEFSYKG